MTRIQTISIAALVILAACASSPPPTVAPAHARRPAVLLLGTSHMANPGRDILNVRWDDVLAAPRQRQLQDLVDRLQRFRPTMVAIETHPGTERVQNYDRYLRGEYTLTKNEIDQIGLRLAKQSGAKVVGIDADADFPYEQMAEYAAAHGQQAVLDQSLEIVKHYIDELNRVMGTATIIELHRLLNTPDALFDGQRSYLKMLQVGGGDAYPGVDLVTAWYKRNLAIFTNLTRVTTSPDDRIVILIGAGHAKLLRQFIEDSGDYELVNTLDYL